MLTRTQLGPVSAWLHQRHPGQGSAWFSSGRWGLSLEGGEDMLGGPTRFPKFHLGRLPRGGDSVLKDLGSDWGKLLEGSREPVSLSSGQRGALEGG